MSYYRRGRMNSSSLLPRPARPVPASVEASLLAPVLALEASCDDSAAAVLAPDGTVLAERVLSQTAHARFGGVVPEIAARAHLATLPGLVEAVLAEAGLRPAGLGLVAATVGPGLIGGLIVGSLLGKGIAVAAGVRFAGINHLEAHALTARMPGLGAAPPAFPYLLLLLSGGHCQCIAVDAVGRYRRLGGTIDDAAGEAFDKVAKMLGLPWPGGPALERLAAEGTPGAVPLPRPLLGRPGCDFSFSGLKTAVRQVVARAPAGAIASGRAADIARGFQDAVADVLADRARHALALLPDATALVIAGGVAANAALRSRLLAVAAAHGIPLAAPPLRYCTDNAAMVGWAAIERARAGLLDPAGDLAAAARPRYPLEPEPPPRTPPAAGHPDPQPTGVQAPGAWSGAG